MSILTVSQITALNPSEGVRIPEFVPNGQFSHRNKIINGKMEIAQRGTSFAAIANNAYSVDRFAHETNTTAVITASQASDTPSDNTLQFSLRYTVTTADTSIAAGDLTSIRHFIEGYNARDLIGRTFTLSFWVRSSKTGTHCVFFHNNGNDRSYVAEYTISAANTWEFKTVTISGGLPTAGTWNWTNGRGVAVGWTLAAGSNTATTAGAWQTGAFRNTSNQVNCLDTIGNIFAITGVQLEVGSVATPFEHRPYGAEVALCQRYYETDFSGTPTCLFSGRVVSGQTYRAQVRFKVSKRSLPTVTLTHVEQVGFPTTAGAVESVTSEGFRENRAANATHDAGLFTSIFAASNEL